MPHYTAYYYASDLKALYAASVNPEKKVSNHTYRVKVEPQRMIATSGIQAMWIKPLYTDGETFDENCYILGDLDVGKVLAGVKYSKTADGIVCLQFMDDTLRIVTNPLTELLEKAEQYEKYHNGNAYTVKRDEAAVNKYPPVKRIFEGITDYHSMHDNFDKFGIGVDTTAAMHAAVSVLTKFKQGSTARVRMIPVTHNAMHMVKLEFRDKVEHEPRIELLVTGNSAYR